MCVHENIKTDIPIETTNKIRIKDIAILAGVSTGTVDRVIHNRGQVAEDIREKIQNIIDELNYKPNLLARSLASKKSYLFVALLPYYHIGEGEYWEAPVEGILKAKKEIADYNITVNNIYFDQFNVESFREKCSEALTLSPDAVLVSPVFTEETKQLAGTLDASNIPYIFIDSKIEGLKNLSYFGQNSYQSGYLAARLLEAGLAEGSKIAIIKPSGKIINNQFISRENGFYAYFTNKKIAEKYQFETIKCDINNESKREAQIAKCFEASNSVSAAITFNSRAHEIARIIEKLATRKIKLIGYDLLRENKEFLRKGFISYLIAQRPEEQGYLSIISFFEHIFLKKEVIKDNYMPIDILTAENLEYYINFKK